MQFSILEFVHGQFISLSSILNYIFNKKDCINSLYMPTWWNIISDVLQKQANTSTELLSKDLISVIDSLCSISLEVSQEGQREILEQFIISRLVYLMASIKDFFDILPLISSKIEVMPEGENKIFLSHSLKIFSSILS